MISWYRNDIFNFTVLITFQRNCSAFQWRNSMTGAGFLSLMGPFPGVSCQHVYATQSAAPENSSGTPISLPPRQTDQARPTIK